MFIMCEQESYLKIPVINKEKVKVTERSPGVHQDVLFPR